MKRIKNVILLLLLLMSSASLHAQLVEGTPCTATCLDPNKNTITGRMPNANGSSPNLNFPCGSGTTEDNPAWWILRPSGTTLTFGITTSNCEAGGCGLGIQMTLWEGDACGSVTSVDCLVGTFGFFTATVSPCKVYYLQLDGLCECVCDVIITYDKNQILKEVPKPEINGSKQVCKGATAKFCASLPSLQGCCPDAYNWTLNPGNAGTITKIPGDPDCVNVRITNPPANGKVTICTEPKFNGKCPPKTNKECFEFDVIELKPATCKVELCPEELPLMYELKNCIVSTNPTFTTGTVKPENYIINLPPGTKKTVTIPYVTENSACTGDVKLDITIKNVGDSSCACGVGKAGKMNLKFIITANDLKKSITVKHQNGTQVLGPNDVGGFVLHEGSENKIVNPIAVNKTGKFSFDSTKMKCGRVYFVSYVVGKKVNNLPDLKDKCLSVVPNGQRIAWICKKKIIGAAAREANQETTQDADYQVNIYPNPTEDKFFIEIPSVKNLTLDLYNTQGQIVLSQKNMIALGANQYEAPVAHLPKGVYVLKMNLDGKTEIRKVVIE